MRRGIGLLVYAPIVLFLLVFAFVPAVGMLIDSFAGDHGGTLSFYHSTLKGQYFDAFKTTAYISLITSAIGVFWGGIITWGVVRLQSNWLRKLITSVSSTMANFAGLPLAVAFMATLGTSGMVTMLIQNVFHLKLADMGWNLSSFDGLVVVYSTFQVPLAIILMLPAFASLNREWEEAVYTLGASLGTYIRRVVLPILFPGLVGTLALLFANAFSSYVTAFAIAGGTVNLVPIQIGYLIDGNVTLNIGLGDALAMEEMLVLALAVILFLMMQRIQSLRSGSGRKSRAS